jgi:hypothetical protein
MGLLVIRELGETLVAERGLDAVVDLILHVGDELAEWRRDWRGDRRPVRARP